MKILSLLATALLAVTLSHAQNPSSPTAIAGRFNVSQYSNWSVQATNSVGTGGQTMFVNPCFPKFGTNVQQLFPFATNSPVIISDGSNSETVTPTSVTTNDGTGRCFFFATFTRAHSAGVAVSSGSFGLEEAINDAHNRGGGIATIDSSWPGTTSMITVTGLGFTNVSVEDNRTGNTLYSWNGSHYVISGGGGAGTSVILAPSADQTIAAGHQLINRGTGQTGFPFTSFDAAIQAFAVNPATGTVAVSGQTSGSGNIGVQGVQTGGGQGSGIFGLGEGLNSATFGGFFTSFANTTTGNPYIGTALYGQLNLTVTGSLPQDTGANAAEGKIYGGTVQSLSSYITAGNQDNAGGTGGVATNSYGYNVSAAMNAGTPGATTNAAFHANDQGSGANNYGILLDGVTHNDLGGGVTKVGLLQEPLSTPASSSATCTAGQIWADTGFVYVCTATDTIKRAALSSF